MRLPLVASSGRHLSRVWSKVPILLPAALALGLWLLNTPAGLLGKADAVGYAVCHRIDLRSFHFGSRALPLCSRCTGMYLGAMLTLAYFTVRGRQRAAGFPKWPLLVTLGLFGLAFAVDGVNSYLSFYPGAPLLYQPSNTFRLITGTLVGVALATVVYPGFNQSAWSDWRAEPALGSFRDLVLILTLATLLVLAVLSENTLVLYPLALLSSLGVVILLTTVYTMMILIVLHRENRATSWRELLFPLAGGLTLSIGQIALLDLVRHLLTGTWNGLSL